MITLLWITGLLAGFAGGLLGIGGCSIVLPVLIMLYNYPEALAIGTTITAVILTALSGSMAHIRLKNFDKNTVILVGFSGSLGALMGDVVFISVSEKIGLLDLVLGAAFIYTSLRMLYEGVKNKKHARAIQDRVPGEWWKKALLGFIVGIITGIVGLGGGYVLVPSFMYLLGASMKIAIGTSLPSFLPLAIVSAIPKLLSGNADVLAAVLLGVGAIIGAQLGAKAVAKTDTRLLKILFGLLFLTVSIRFLIKGMTGL